MNAIPKRPTQTEYFMTIANLTATRATCDRLHVGCVLVLSGRIIATGYNGSVSGSAHCDDVGHAMISGHCKRTIHAEVNALLDCAKRGVSCDKSTAYVTHEPCVECSKALVQAGISRIVIGELYETKHPVSASVKREVLGRVLVEHAKLT